MASKTSFVAYAIKFWIALLSCLSCTAVMASQIAAAEQPLTLALYGDSLSAGYGLQDGEGFADQLQNWVSAQGLHARIVNMSVSGDTSAGGLARLDWSLSSGNQPDALILELGANDALRGLPPEETQRNLDAIITQLTSRNIPVFLAGMLAPRNWGANYEAQFNAIYPALARKHNVPLYPFFLDGVVAQAELNQSDGIHPNPAGVSEIVKRIGPKIEAFIKNLQRVD